MDVRLGVEEVGDEEEEAEEVLLAEEWSEEVSSGISSSLEGE